jgi:hypothetical protein
MRVGNGVSNPRAQKEKATMMNVNNRILMEALESRTRADLASSVIPHSDSKDGVPDTYPQPLQPDELALQETLVEIACDLHPDHGMFFG